MAKSAILSVRIVSDSKGAITGLKKTSAAVAGLQRVATGARSVSAGIFTTIPRLAMMATMLSSLAAVALSSVGSILSLGGALASIAPAALVLPGLLGGVAVAGGVLIAALKDAGDHLGELGPLFSEVQDSISVSFWERAAEPIRSMVTSLLPAIEGGLSNVASQLGGWAVAISGAVSSAEGMADIQGIINRTADAIDLAGDGVGFFTSALLTLTNVGAGYLAPLASSFSSMAERFNDWVQSAYESGDIFQWIDTGIEGLKLLGSSLVSIGSIFAGLTRAATEAGGIGLAGFAGGLEHIAAIVNSETFQTALITVFEGANEAVALLSPGITALGGAFAALAPTIAAILPLATDAFSSLLEGVSTALSHPAVAGGLKLAFEGINTGVTALAGIFEKLAPLLGAALELFGGLAAGVLPVLSAIITTIAPPITAVVQAIAGWVSANPQLAATLIAVVGGIGALVPVVLSVVSFVGSLLGVWATLSAAFSSALAIFGGVTTVLSLLGVSLSSIILPIIGIVSGVALLVAGFVTALATSETFRAALAGLMQSFINLVQPIIATVLPVIQQMVAAFIDAGSKIIAAMVPLVTTIVQIAAAILDRLRPIVDFLMGIFGPAFEFIGTVVSAAFSYISDVISGAISFINSILQVFLSALQGDWSGAWEALKNVVSTGMDFIKTVFSGAIDFLKTIGQAGLDMLRSIFENTWGSIKDAARSAIDWVVDVFRTGMDNLKSAVSTGVDAVMGFFRDLPGKIKGVFSDAGSMLLDIGKNIIRGLIDGIKSMATAVTDAIGGVVGDVKQKAKNLLGIKSPSRVFRSFGNFVSVGLANGIKAGSRKAVGATESMVSRVERAGAGLELSPTMNVRAPKVDAYPSDSAKSSVASRQPANVININFNGVVGDRVAAATEIERLLREKQILLGAV